MPWKKALDKKEAANLDRMVVTIDDEKVLIIKDKDTLYACDNMCPHMNLPLQIGRVEDGEIHCPWHRSAFKLDSGDVVDWSKWPPGIGVVLGKLSKEKALPIFPVEEREDGIYIKMGDDGEESHEKPEAESDKRTGTAL